MVTVSGFIAEAGDIGRFDNPKQLQKLAGYASREMIQTSITEKPDAEREKLSSLI